MDCEMFAVSIKSFEGRRKQRRSLPRGLHSLSVAQLQWYQTYQLYKISGFQRPFITLERRGARETSLWHCCDRNKAVRRYIKPCSLFGHIFSSVLYKKVGTSKQPTARTPAEFQSYAPAGILILLHGSITIHNRIRVTSRKTYLKAAPIRGTISKYFTNAIDVLF